MSPHLTQTKAEQESKVTYVVTAGDYIKIGCTRDHRTFMTRLTRLQEGNPHKLKALILYCNRNDENREKLYHLCDTLVYRNDSGYSLEQKILCDFKAFIVRGEWLDGSALVLIKARFTCTGVDIRIKRSYY